MMKKLMVLGLIAVMVMAFAMSASAYIIKAQGSAPGALSAGSITGQISNEASSFTPLAAALSPEATYALYKDNVVGSAGGSTLKMNPAPAAWYGYVEARGGYNGQIEVRFFSTTTASKLAAGTWYLYKGIGVVDADGYIRNLTKDAVVDTASFATTESDWTKSTFGGVFASGDQWTLTTAQISDVPEPGSMVAMLSGLVGLVGFGIRRRK